MSSKDLGSKQDGNGSNVLSFSAPGRVREEARPGDENILTAEGLLLMHAFFEIASSEDRRQVIALAERLKRPNDRTAKE
jgi:hypothetical protein